jgi:rod shape determining protein RodA
MRLMFDRRLIYHFDIVLMVIMLCIIALGTVSVYSASFDPTSARASSFAWRQAMWGGLGVIAALAMVTFDYRKLERYAYVAYAGGLAMLIAVPLVGSVSNGSRRWLDLGPFSVQPSEMMKLALIIVLARYFHRKMRPEGLRLRELVLPVLLTLPPVGLILMQPDLGTAGVFCFVAASMVVLAGPSARTYGIIFGAVLSAVPALPYVMAHLKPYQLKRLQTFLNPELDPLGAGYHVIQSKIAIGSGGLYGKGFLHGTQNQLKFLPEQHTDFIFSVFSEEWGFVGAIALISLYLALMVRGLVVVGRAKERFGALLAFGVLANIFWQAVINLGMTTGMLPVVGITLPFFSYGGSSLVTLMAGLGLVINVNMRRFSPERIPNF